MGAEKLSFLLDSALAATVWAAAGEQGVSVSPWLADAVQTRQRKLREALDVLDVLDVLASEEGELDPAEIDRLIAGPTDLACGRRSRRRSVTLALDTGALIAFEHSARCERHNQHHGDMSFTPTSTPKRSPEIGARQLPDRGW
ncbi:MAG: hypothetical protein WBF75_17745 [Pseudonocardiaceae bacterium]